MAMKLNSLFFIWPVSGIFYSFTFYEFFQLIKRLDVFNPTAYRHINLSVIVFESFYNDKCGRDKNA
jgi:hypothetical protein